MKRSDACICTWNHPENMRLIQVANGVAVGGKDFETGNNS